MKLSALKPIDTVIEEHRADPSFRKAWDGSAFAREVAIRIVQYRVDHDLTQTELAARLGMKQPAVARLESGEETPTLKTLAHITKLTGLVFHLDVSDGTVALTAA